MIAGQEKGPIRDSEEGVKAQCKLRKRGTMMGEAYREMGGRGNMSDGARGKRKAIENGKQEDGTENGVQEDMEKRQVTENGRRMTRERVKGRCESQEERERGK